MSKPNREKHKVFFGPDYAILARTMRYDRVSATNKEKYAKYLDYARYRTLELVAEQINNGNVQGDVAEAGVNEGDFAFMINLCFPDRSLYLYDTFEGFDKKDIDIELRDSYSNEEWLKKKPFSPDSEDKVKITLSKMRYPERCIVRKGYFPETAILENSNTFAFVSIDMDLYAPIRAGLEFFYSRLAKGGCIFLHDYNHDIVSGAKTTVREVEELFGELHKVPLADGAGRWL
jgi:O-methyltransferase